MSKLSSDGRLDRATVCMVRQRAYDCFHCFAWCFSIVFVPKRCPLLADMHDLTEGSNFGAFSAVAWYFGRQLADKLNTSVPLGLISSNIGGTAIQDWSPAASNLECDAPPYPPYLPFPPVQGVKPVACPYCLGNATLYNGNIAPYTVGPMRVSGFLWYQGEPAQSHKYYNFCHEMSWL